MLIKCPECSRQISDKAMWCVYCGLPMEHLERILKEQEAQEKLAEAEVILQNANTICKVNEVEYDFKDELLLILSNNLYAAMSGIGEKTHLDDKCIRAIIEIMREKNEAPSSYYGTVDEEWRPKEYGEECPKCHGIIHRRVGNMDLCDSCDYRFNGEDEQEEENTSTVKRMLQMYTKR